MRKMTTKRLAIDLETIRILSDDRLARVVGARPKSDGGCTVFGPTCLDPNSNYQCTTTTCPLSNNGTCVAC